MRLIISNKSTCFLVAFVALSSCGADWLQFRGPNAASVAGGQAPPATWSETENTAWKIPLPGRGVSSPLVVKGRVFVTCSSGSNQERLQVLCFDADTGESIWTRDFWATGRTLCHPFSAVAAPTPASDGERIFAFYSSNDLVCLDLDGNLQWYRGLAFDYPKAGNDIGMSSSPVVAGDTVVVQIENQGDSFAAGIDVLTGETRWRIARDASANWSSPIALSSAQGEKHIVVLQSRKGVTAYDAKSGDQLWYYELSCSTTPSPAFGNDRIYIPANGLTVLEVPDDASVPSLAWESSQLNPNPASPIVVGDRVYTVNGSGVLTCGEAASGKRLWQLRIGGRYWSTPVVAGNRMYCINADGAAKVVQLGDQGSVVGSSQFGEEIKGSPAISNGALYVRSDKHLWKISSE